MGKEREKLPEREAQAFKKYREAARRYAWWAENCFRILPREGVRRYIPFKFNTIQQSVANKIQRSGKKYIAAVLPRRVGKTSFFSGKACHICDTEANRYCLITAHLKPVAQRILRRLKFQLTASPQVARINDVDIPIQPQIPSTSKDEIVFCHDFKSPNPSQFSRIDVNTAGGGEAVGRGEDYDYIHIAEAGQPEYHDYEMYMAATQCLPVYNYLVVLEGTPYGVGGPFYDKFIEGWTDPEGSEFCSIFEKWIDYLDYQLGLEEWEDPESWNVHLHRGKKPLEAECGPEYELLTTYGISLPQMKWARKMVKSRFGRNLQADPWEYFHQEYPIDPYRCWLVQGTSIFMVDMMNWGIQMSRKAMEDMIHPITGKPIEISRYRAAYKKNGEVLLQKDASGPWRFMEDVETDLLGRPVGAYLVSVDIAEGKQGRDWTVIKIWKKTAKGPDRCIGLCRVKDPNLSGLARQVASVAYRYNVAGIMPESNGKMGGSFVYALINTGYPAHKIYMMPAEAEAAYRGGYKATPGWLTTPKSKPLIIDTLHDRMWHYWQDPFGDEGVEILWPEFWNETRTFTSEGVSLGASKGSFDDCVMAAAIGNYGLVTWVRPPVEIPTPTNLPVPGKAVPAQGIEEIFKEVEFNDFSPVARF